jgi:hypothetical protein
MPFVPIEKNLGFISVQDLADALNGRQKKIQLPSFQRDAIWDESHIETLWDSILRGFPISSFLFARVNGLNAAELGLRATQISRAEAARGTSEEISDTELIIIDGQQRSIAIALGLRQWRPKDSARLWLDLGQPEKPESELYRFYVCSFLKPWGENATAAMQRDALQAADARIRKNSNTLQITDETLKHTWPVRAELPVPFADLLTWLNGNRSGDWQDLVPKAKRSGQPRDDLDALFQKVKAVTSYQIPVFLAEELSVEQLGQVFHRLNKQGYEMSNEDLFFSALKMVWPQAHDLVWEIYSDEQTGRFMQPTKIVHAAVRLVAVPGGGDVVGLDRREFEKFVDRKDAQSVAYLDKLKVLLRQKFGTTSVGHLHHCLRLARQALQYNPDNGLDDPGLPVTLLARLRWRVWHTIAAWIYRHNTVDPHSRMEMLRYALLDYFFTSSTSTTLIREPFKLALDAPGHFPGLEIYQAFKAPERNLLALHVLTPAEFQTRLTEPDVPVYDILQRERELVLWIQRAYFQCWFPQFDPTLYKKEADLPYDLDHIIPWAHMNMQGRRYKWPEEFWSFRNQVLNGAGNFRYWPKALNRADGQKNLAEKYLLGDANRETPADSYLRDLGLNTVGEVRQATFMLDDQVPAWEKAANINGDVYNWTDLERLHAFRQATDRRRTAMYATFFTQLGWSNWLENDDSQPTDGVSL